MTDQHKDDIIKKIDAREAARILSDLSGKLITYKIQTGHADGVALISVENDPNGGASREVLHVTTDTVEQMNRHIVHVYQSQHHGPLPDLPAHRPRSIVQRIGRVLKSVMGS